MTISKLEWQDHMKKYEESELTIKGYCIANNLNEKQFRNRRYLRNRMLRKKPNRKNSFKEYMVGVSVSINVDPNGTVSISGLLPDNLPDVLRALSVIS